MGSTLIAGGRLALSVGALVGSIRLGVVGAMWCGGLTRGGDGTMWVAGRWLLGGRWCGVAVVGQIRCSRPRGVEGWRVLGARGCHMPWAAVGGCRWIWGVRGVLGVLGR